VSPGLGRLRKEIKAGLRKLRRGQPSDLPLIPFLIIKGLNYVVLYAQVGFLKSKILLGITAEPFDKVPVFLRVVVRRLRRHAGQREVVYIRAAIAVVAYYINVDTPFGRNDPFLQIKAIPGTTLADPHYQLRICLIAETLFLLRKSDGFNEFCRRLRRRDLRATFYETLAARLFFDARYQVHSRPEQYIKGEDYDFWTIKDGSRINVEVTTLAEQAFYAKTIRNSLNQKRKQLPNTAAAVIIIVLPNQWAENHPNANWDAYLLHLSSDFFRTSKRISTIIFLQEQFVQMVHGIGIALVSYHYVHPSPRFPIKDRAFIPISHDLRLVSDSEFFRWVDSIVPRIAP
jgi:hypothetical protein